MAVPSTKRAWKLQEFVAHGSNVKCVALGHKTGRVMVSGGDDKKVNLWTVGKPNCVMSLSGHTSAVEAVRFGNAEEMVVAGSMSGALKIWDLEQAKILRTLTGHKANIRCLDFHPYGEFVASGSLDTNVKLWDIRRKGCIFTYKGHTNGINSLRFSPDGRWVASAAEDSLIKIWDLAAGRLLTELKDHTASVNSIEFHPSEYLLASGSSDRSIKFWELERFQCVDSTDYDNNGIRSVMFHPDGQCIFGGSTDLVKVYGWEPCRCHDSINMGWGRVYDMAIAQNQLIGASINQTNVCTFVLDLTRVAPLGQVPSTPAPPMSSSGRKSYSHERPPTTSTKQQMPHPTAESSNRSNGRANRQVRGDSSSRFRQDNLVPVSTSDTDCRLLTAALPSRSSSPSLSARSSSPAPGVKRRSLSRNSDLGYSVKQTKSSTLRRCCSMMINSSSDNRNQSLTRSPSVRAAHASSPRFSRTNRIHSVELDINQNYDSNDNGEWDAMRTSRSRQRIQSTSMLPSKPAEEPDDSTTSADDGGDDASSTADVKDRTEYEQVFQPKSRLAKSPPQQVDPFPAPYDDDSSVTKLAKELTAASVMPDPAIMRPMKDSPAPAGQAPTHLPSQSNHSNPSNRNLDKPFIEPSDFMPPTTHRAPHNLTDYDALGQISKGHNSMATLLAARSKNLQIVRAMWSSGNIRTALESALQMRDDSVLVDILNVLNDKPHYWSLDVIELLIVPLLKLLQSKFQAPLWGLDVAAVMLPHIKRLITSKYDSHVTASCGSLKLILKNYTPLIRENLTPPNRLGVDITGEERHRKCLNIYRAIQDIRSAIDGKQNQAGKLAGTFKEIQLLLNHLDT